MLQVTSRAEAKAASYKRYFTGLVCANGHISERQTSSGNCLACSAARKRNRAPEKKRLDSAKWLKNNKESANQNRRKRRKLNLEKRKIESISYYQKNREIILLKKAEFSAKNRDLLNYRQRVRNAKSPDVMRFYAKLRSAAKKNALPKWFSELDALVWAEAYDLTGRRKAATGIKWHADHMIPIQAKSVMGLHVWNNCQVIPAAMNQYKKNKLIWTRSGEWVGEL